MSRSILLRVGFAVMLAAGIALAVGCGGGSGLGSNNQPPVVNLTHNYTGTPYTGAPIVVTFVANATDADGTISLYEWDDAYDGSFDVSYSSPVVNSRDVTFNGGGSYTVAVLVTDNKGAKTFKSVTLLIVGNQAPNAVLTVTPASGMTGTTFTLDASGSTDPEAGTLTFEWDLDYDGTTFVPNATYTTATINNYTFATEKTYTVAVQVTDNGVPAASIIATKDVIISSVPVNSPPTLSNPTVNPPTMSTPGTVTFGISFVDPEGDACTVEWDPAYNWTAFTPDAPPAAAVSPVSKAINFPTEGTKYVGVRITDINGASSVYIFAYSIGEFRADFWVTNAAGVQVFTRDISVDPILGTGLQKDTRGTEIADHWDAVASGEPWTWFTGTAEHPYHPAVYVCTTSDLLYFHDGTVPTGTFTYGWDFGDGVGASATQNPTYQYTLPGIYLVRLHVATAGGAWDRQTSVIAVMNPSGQAVLTHAMIEGAGAVDHWTTLDKNLGAPVGTGVWGTSTNVIVDKPQTRYGVMKTDYATYAPAALTAASIQFAGIAMPVCRNHTVYDNNYDMYAWRIDTDWTHDAVTWNQIIGAGNTLDTAIHVIRDPVDPHGVSLWGTGKLMELDGFVNEPKPYPCYLLECKTAFSAWLGGTANQGMLIAINDFRTQGGDVNFMEAGRTSQEYSRHFEPVVVIIYTP